jgi:hypothetical protein
LIGPRFTVAKRQVAMFCVALCMALSTQMTMVVLDRLKHVFQIDHAPTGLAGPVFDHGHHLKHDVQHSPDRPHTHPHHGAEHHHHAHDLQHSSGEAHAHNDAAPHPGFHTHEWLPEGHDHGPITHHHHGSGMLTPWLVSTPLQIAALPLRIPVLDYGIEGHPDAPAWRRDRPPKLNLGRIV